MGSSPVHWPAIQSIQFPLNLPRYRCVVERSTTTLAVDDRPLTALLSGLDEGETSDPAELGIAEPCQHCDLGTSRRSVNAGSRRRLDDEPEA